jgi:peptidoglycan hydrolase-like protein with peptidoglycan-binding domain
LREALLSLGHCFPQSNAGGRLDGAYGSETTRNVGQFQRAQGLMADGAAGKQTLEKLDAILSSQSASGPAEGAGNVWGQPAVRFRIRT